MAVAADLIPDALVRGLARLLDVVLAGALHVADKPVEE
jgi:hypothetical protein